MPRKTEPVVFQVEFKKGTATRNRLPLADVLGTLQELDLMIRELGKKVQRDSGVENPDGDFGMELLAGSTGIAFAKGSIKSHLLITKDIENGVRTVSRVIGTTAIVEKKEVTSVDEYGAPVVRRLAKIGDIQEGNKTELHLQLAQKGKITDKANLSKNGLEALRALSASDFAIESVTLYGKLKKLADFGRDDEEGAIWGQLVEDNGNIWRVRFAESDLQKVKNLFRQQVVVSGDANYFKTKNPRLDAKTIGPDKDRNYVTGFKRFRKNYRAIFGDRDPQEILKDIRG
ncbi:MAG: hypothetical protein WAQ52_17140 [Terriglobales bacterium]